MNANELAEIIEHLENARYIGASKAATMLRQQQAEIEELKLAKKVILRYAEEDIAKYKAEIVLLNQVTSKKLK